MSKYDPSMTIWKQLMADPSSIRDVLVIALRDFDEWDWALLIARHPTIFEFCNHITFGPNAWHAILVQQPQLAEFCDWSKLDVVLIDNLVRLHPSLQVYSLVFI